MLKFVFNRAFLIESSKDLFDEVELDTLFKDEDEESMTSGAVLGGNHTPQSGDNYAPGDNRLPGLLFKKPIKRKKITESAENRLAQLEIDFENGLLSPYEFFKAKKRLKSEDLTDEELEFFQDEKTLGKRPATKEELEEFFRYVREITK